MSLLHYFLAIATIYVLVHVGLVMSSVNIDLLWIDASFLQNLAPEVGGAGVDIIVGALAGWIAASIVYQKKWSQMLAYIDLRRDKRPDTRLSELTREFQSDLSLHGLNFIGENDPIELKTFRKCSFAAKGSEAASFSDISFAACNFIRSRFGQRGTGCNITRTSFEDSLFRSCNYSGCTFQAEGSSNTFLRCQVSRCDFSGSSFSGASFEDCGVTQSSFWGCRFDSGAQLQQQVYDQLLSWGAIERLSTGGFRIKEFREFLLSQDSRRIIWLRDRILGIFGR